MDHKSFNHETQTPPVINNTFKIKNLDRFFYEYATAKKIDITHFDISQNDLNLELDMVYHKFFKKEILDTIFISDHKNYLVNLSTYSLKNYTIKIPEKFFDLFESAEFLSGKITLEFDKIRGFFYISNFEKWGFDFTLNDYLSNQNLNFKSLLLSLGYNNLNLLFREKISLIARLLPCVEKNINIAEITKPQVGKSFIFDEIITKNSIVKKLGDLTPTNLFSPINSTIENEAILKNYSILCIDEFHKGDLREIIAGLQTFMENGKVSRGKKSYHSDTSIIMFANFKKDNFYKKIFVNPKEFNPFKDISGIDKAFLQRIDYINPSFGMRTLNESMFLNKDELRIPTSLYQNIFDELRKIDIDLKKIFPNLKIFNNTIEIDIRITNSILKITSGFLKLLFPLTLNNIINNSLSSVDINYLSYCFYLAMEGSSFLSILQNISNTNSLNFSIYLENNIIIQLGNYNLYKNIIEYFLEKPFNVTNAVYPHRFVYMENVSNQYNLNKIPLDTIGIEENIQENLLYSNIHHETFLKNNFLIISQFYTNNFYYTPYKIWFNISQIYNLVFFKSLYKNYLFGYNLIYPQYNNLIYPQQFDTTFFGQMILFNNFNITCPKCSNTIISFNNEFSLISIDPFLLCPYCNEKIFNYDLFPNLFEDYKG